MHSRKFKSGGNLINGFVCAPIFAPAHRVLFFFVFHNESPRVYTSTGQKEKVRIDTKCRKFDTNCTFACHCGSKTSVENDSSSEARFT